MQECASSVPDPVFPRDVVEIETNAGCGGWSSQPFMDILISGDGERERDRDRGVRDTGKGEKQVLVETSAYTTDGLDRSTDSNVLRG